MKLRNRFSTLVCLMVVLVSWHQVPTATGQLVKHGHGAVEFLLATGILAKLLDLRHKHGGHHHHGRAKARHIMHAVLGSFRYPRSRHPMYRTAARYPQSAQMLSETVLDPGMALGLQDSDLIFNGDRHLLTKAQMLGMSTSAMPFLPSGQIMPTDMQLLAAQFEAQQKLLAASQARNLLAAQQARKLLSHQGQVRSLMSDQDARQFLASSKNNKEMPSSADSQNAQARQMMLDDDLGDLIAASEALIPSEPEMLVANPTGVHPAFLSQDDSQYVALRRHDFPFFDDEFIMRYLL